MATEECIEASVEEPAPSVTEKTAERPVVTRPWVSRRLTAVIVGSTLLVLIVIVAMIGAMLHSAERFEGHMRTANSQYGYMGRDGGPMMRDQHGSDGSTDTSNVTRIGGVITVVDGSTLTVAGNGTTTKVTTSDGTIYSGNASPAKVNDTVRVLGNKLSDGSIAASQITIQRQ